MPLLRALLRSPRTSLPALLLLAIGVGGFAWMLGLRRSVMLRSLPARDPGALVALWNGDTKKPQSRGTPAYGEFHLMRQQLDVFEGVAASGSSAGNLDGDIPERVKLDQISPNFFQVLGVAPSLGRDFRPGEGEPGAAKAVLLTHALWKRRFGGDPTLVGQQIRLDGQPHEVIGILPASFHTPQGTEAFTVLPGGLERQTDFGAHYLQVLGRLRPGLGLAQAQAAMARATESYKQIRPDFFSPGAAFATLAMGASPLLDDLLGPGAKALQALNVAAGLVLLIAALNAAAMLLARALGRRRELAVRAALGASPAHLRRLLVAEGALLGLGGAALGLLLAKVGLRAATQALSWSFPDLPLDGVRIDLLTVLLSLGFGPCLGALCALWGRPDAALSEALKEGGRGQVGSGKRLRQHLVLAQLALATTLLGAAAWIHGGIRGLVNRDLGFRPEGVYTFQLSPSQVLQRDYPRLAALESQVIDRVRQLPGVKAAGGLNSIPLNGFMSDRVIRVAGIDRPFNPQARSASPGALQALGLRLLQGRDFTEADGAASTPVVLLTRNLAKACFGDKEALGRQIHIPPDHSATVVGILDDFREFGPARPAPQVFFVPYAQGTEVWSQTLHVVLRTEGPAPSEQALREAIKTAAPGLGLHGYAPLSAHLDRTLGSQRMARACAAVFAGLALLLAAGGIYGLMASTMAERRGEFGIRAALGATSKDLLRMVLGEASRLVLFGGLAGVAAAFLLRTVGDAWLGELPTDGAIGPLLAFGAVLGAALAATLPPAWRAAKADPMTALRAE